MQVTQNRHFAVLAGLRRVIQTGIAVGDALIAVGGNDTLTDAINVFFQQSLNAGGFPFAVTEDNAEIIKAKALSRLTRQLQEAQDDPVSYSEDEVYKMFGVEK